MAWVVIASGDVDAKSPISDTLMGNIKGDLDHLYSMLTDAGSAPEGISTSTLDTSGNATVGGDLAVTGNLSVGTFFSSEQVLFLYW
jgi:hypothetical protein